jgi:hypothetical protein
VSLTLPTTGSDDSVQRALIGLAAAIVGSAVVDIPLERSMALVAAQTRRGPRSTPMTCRLEADVDALLAENVQLRQAADLFRANFSPWLIHNAPDLYRSLWGEW